MERLLVMVAIAAVALLVAWLVRRRRPDPPTQPTYTLPAQLDRADFHRPDAPWLVVLFSSATCLSCRGTWEKVTALDATDVAVQDVDAVDRRGLHERYDIDAVPAVLVADHDGVVRATFLGEPSAADLWAKLADLRAP